MRSKNCFLDSEYNFLSGHGGGEVAYGFQNRKFCRPLSKHIPGILGEVTKISFFSPLELKAQLSTLCCDIWWNFQDATGPKLTPTHCSAIND